MSGDHARRYERLGVPPDRIRVTGDARFDQVLARIDARGLLEIRDAPAGEDGADGRLPVALRAVWPLLADPDAFTVVAGSTWPADEELVVPPFAVLRRGRRVRLAVAPHEPTPLHLEALERRLDRNNLRHARLSAIAAAGRPPSSPPPEVVVVDRIGVLADLYAAADVAYVGGGFGTAGLHSVVEPAALGVPVLFGPTHGNALEAGALAAAGGGFVVRGTADIEARLSAFADDPATARSMGRTARSYVESGSGAAARNAALIAGLLGHGSGVEG